MLKLQSHAIFAALLIMLSGCGYSDTLNRDGSSDICYYEAELIQAGLDDLFEPWKESIDAGRKHYFEKYRHHTAVKDNLYYFADECGLGEQLAWANTHVRDEIALNTLSSEEFAQRVEAALIRQQN